MSDNLLYLKFLLDPIVYAWRMLNYRDSFGKIYRPHKDIGGESKLVDIDSLYSRPPTSLDVLPLIMQHFVAY